LFTWFNAYNLRQPEIHSPARIKPSPFSGCLILFTCSFIAMPYTAQLAEKTQRLTALLAPFAAPAPAAQHHQQM